MRGPALPMMGGLDLVSPAAQARPGTLASCLNYEVASRAGYSRISGFERFDGRPGVADFRALRLVASSISGAIDVGTEVEFAADTPALPHQSIHGFVTATGQTDGGLLVLDVAFAGGMPDPIVPDTLSAIGSIDTAQIVSFESLDYLSGTQQAVDDALFELASARRAEMTAVPGRDDSDVLGGFMFKDRAYAIRDLPFVYFEAGYYTDADEGLAITVDGVDHEILEVRLLGYESGYVIYDPNPAPPGMVVATGIGSPTLTTLPISGSLSDGFETIDYLDGLVVTGGVAPYQWSLAEDAVAPPAPGEITDLSEITMLSEVTAAALWRATPVGWERVELGREMAFTDGAAGLRGAPRKLSESETAVLDTGWLAPGLVEVDGFDLTSVLSNPNDSTYLSVGAASINNAIVAKGFDFSSIPAGAQIVGIECQIIRRGLTANTVKDKAVTLVGVGGGGENKARGAWEVAAAMGDPESIISYGGASDLWGVEDITTATIGDPNFGVMLIIGEVDPMVTLDGQLHNFAIKVHYIERTGLRVYAWDGATDVPLTITHLQLLDGDLGQSSGKGFMTLTADKNSAKARLVNVGDEIRSAPVGGGSVLAIAASRDRPIFLPGQFEIDNNRSQYQWEEFNFFAQDRYAAMYGVSGAGPALAFDGEIMTKVRTPLAPGLDVPRHIAKHGTMLALGFYSGAVVLSTGGDPYEMRGAFGASAIEVGRRLTALSPAGGDALLIVCASSTFVLRGLSPLVFSQTTVSARRGALEYTLADPGKAIIADNFGLFFADTPESFAAASVNYMSAPVEPWLRGRLQAVINNEQRFLRPVCSIAVRSKNQYRMYFRDGSVLTMTVMAEGNEITRQRLFVPDENGDIAERLSIRKVWSGIDASGRERVFAAFNGGSKQGYVFELDVGRSFDGDAIPAEIVINPFFAGSISQLKSFDRLFIGGTGGYADLLISRGKDGAPVAGEERLAQFGFPTQLAAPESGAERVIRSCSTELATEAYSVSYRVRSLTNREAPHTLQYAETFINVRGDSRGHTGDS